MKTNNAKWMRFAAGLLSTVVLLTTSFVGQASARILFEDDEYFNVNSEGIILDYNDNIDTGGDVILQFGNDGTDATVTYNDTSQDITLAAPGGDFSFSDDNVAGTGGLDFDGNINFTNASELHLREVADEATATCTTLDELVIDTTENTLYICTGTGSPGTWTNTASVAGTDLQGAYDADASGAHEILLAAGDGEAVEIRANANGDDLLQMQNSSATNLIEFADLGGNTIDINSQAVDWDATTQFILDSTGAISIDAADASNFSTTSGDMTLSATTNSVIITGAEAAADAVDINASNAAGGIDIDSGTGGITIDTTGAFSVDGAGAASNVALAADGAADDLTIAVTGAFDSSLFLQSAGTGSDAIGIAASAGGVDIDAAAASSFTTSAGALGLDGAGGVNIQGNAAEVDITTTGAVDINSGAFTVDGSTVAITSAGAGNDITFTSADDIIFDDGTLVTAVDLNVNETALSANYSANGIIDALNDFQSVTEGAEGATYVATDAADFTNFSPAGNTVQDALEAIDTAVGSANEDFDDVYDNSQSGGNLTMEIDNGSLNYNITTADSFAIQDSGTNIAEFTGAGAVNFDPTSGQNFDVATLGTGDVIINSADDIDIDSATINIDTSGQTAINTSTWDISGPGIGSGFTGFTSTGVVDFSGASRFAMDQGAANPGTCTEGDLHYNTTDNTTYVCTAANTWTALSTGNPDFEAVYGTDADDTLTASGTFDIDAVGAVGIDSDAGLALGGTSIALTADGGILSLTGDGTADIDISNAGAAIDVDSATLDILTSSTFSIDGSGASNVTTDSGNLTLSTTTSGDVAANAAGDVTLTAGDDIIFDDAQLAAPVQMTDTATAIDAEYGTTGIIDAFNLLADFTAGDGADIVGVEDGSLTNVTLGNSSSVQDALEALDAVIGSGADNVEDLTFYPEYPDATVYADGTNNRGTLESDYDATEESNYYNWTSRRPATQDIDVRFQFPLPTDFNATGDFTYRFRTGSATEADNDVEIRLYNVTDTQECANDLTNVNAGAWATGTIAAAAINGGCTGGTALGAGDIVEVRVKMYDNSGAADYADIGYLSWAYTN